MLRVTVALALEQFDLITRNRALKTENAQKAKEISALSKLAATHRSRLGIMLHKKNLLNAAQLQELTLLQERRKEPLISLLIDKGWVGERQIRDLLKSDMLIEEVQLPEFQVDPALTDLIPRSLCARQLVVPLKLDGKHLLLAMADPSLLQGTVNVLRLSLHPQGLAPHLAPGGEGWLILSDLAEHLGLRSRDVLLAWMAAAGLRVVARLDARPVHGKATDVRNRRG